MYIRISSQLKRGFFRYITDNRLTIFFYLLLVLGIIIGCLSLSGNTNIAQVLERYLNSSATTFLNVFRYSLLVSVLPMILIYCSGLFLYGSVPCSLLFLFQGMGYGAISGYIYSVYGILGVAFVLLALLPCCFFNIVLQLFGCKEAFRFSLLLCKHYYKDVIVSTPSNHLKRYHYKFLVLLAFGFVVATFNSLLSFVFIGVIAL